MKFLSMLPKRLASPGSCLTMSPPLNTASMYIHMACTASHCSIVSLDADSLLRGQGGCMGGWGSGRRRHGSAGMPTRLNYFSRATMPLPHLLPPTKSPSSPAYPAHLIQACTSARKGAA